MRIHTHRQNRDDRHRIVRMFHAWLYGRDERTLAHANLELVHHRKPSREFSARFHLGKRWSETPLDAHLTLAGTGAYVSLDAPALGRIAHALTGGNGRDLSLSMHDGQFWWSLWATEEHCNGEKHSHRRGGKYRPWLCRKGNLPVNPLDILWGGVRYSYEDLAKETAVLAMPEGEYEVELTLQRMRRGRPGRKQSDAGLVVDWSAPTGIPFRFDHSGGWKGSRYYASAVKVPDGIEQKDWASVALSALAAEALTERVRTGWTPEHEASIAS